MSSAHYASRAHAEVITIELLPPRGDARAVQLLVDTGFTGTSSVILGLDAADLIRAEVPPSQATGALQGAQDRGWVTCRVPELGCEHTLIAIITDVSALSLPEGVQGMAGLSFLRYFTRWGAEQAAGGWRFFLGDP